MQSFYSKLKLESFICLKIAQSRTRSSAVKAHRARCFSSEPGTGTRKRVRNAFIQDSLSGQKQELDVLLGRDPVGVVTMYVCGPTVYDDAHLGHARTYVQFDAIRRILGDVLNYEVSFFMNITDVDDKIIKRAKETNTSFSDLARKHEIEFFTDMELLGVKPPVFSPRATDYIDDMIAFILKLEKEGLTYCGPETGSVYFSTDKMTSTPSAYGALDPARNNQDSNYLESETSDKIKGDKRNLKDFALWKCRVPGDEDEDEEDKDGVWWPSPWGHGRPGWHTECSAMIDSTAGSFRHDGRLDIHGGGVDLRFPHHENERAQSQSLLQSTPPCCDNAAFKNWTSIFMHTGHLHISGRKMSKSLKNFITIKTALNGGDDYDFPVLTPRQLRLLFLSHRYNSAMEFSKEVLEEAMSLDKQFAEFFANTKILLLERAADHNLKQNLKWIQSDTDFLNKIATSRGLIHGHLCDDFDIPAALEELRIVVKLTNIYMMNKENTAKAGPVREACQIVSKYLNILGIGGGNQPFGIAVNGYEEKGITSSGNKDDLAQVLDVLTQFRSDIRSALRSDNSKGRIFQLCDELRDEHLAKLNIAIEDRKKGSVWKKLD